MARLGADTDALRSLSRQLRAAARGLDDAALGLERRVRAVGWHGVDADRFGQDWTVRHRPSLQVVSQRCIESATTLDRQIDEQVQASTGSVVLPGPVLLAGPTGVVTAPDGLPESELRLAAGTEVAAAGLLGALAHDLTVARLADHRSRVVVTETSRGGAAATFGASLRVGGAEPLVRASADVRLTAATITRREYLVADREVWPTVLRVESELALGRVLDATEDVPGVELAARMVDPAVSLWDWALDRVPGADVDLSGAIDAVSVAPRPDRVEHLTELALGVGAGLSAGTQTELGANAELSGSIRFGSASGGDGPDARIIELEGEVTGELTGLLDRVESGTVRDTAHTGTLRLVVPDDAQEGVDLTLIRTWSDGSTLQQIATNVALADGTAAQVSSGIDAVFGHLARGQVSAAIERIARLDPVVESAVSTTGRMSVDDRAYGVGGSIGGGVGAVVSGDAEVQHLERLGPPR